MKDEQALGQAETYVDELEIALGELPADQQATIVEDIRAHIADALDEGQAIEQIMARLGAPSEVAGTALVELAASRPAVPSDTTSSVEASRRLLLLAAAAVGMLTAVVVSFLLPLYQTVSSAGVGPDGVLVERTTATATLVQQAGAAAVLLTLVPVVFAVLPLLRPSRMRAGFTLAGAIAVVFFAIIGLFTVGAFYLPLVFLMWAAVIVPGKVARGLGRTARRVWRGVAGVVVVLPALLLLAGFASGAILIGWGSMAWIVVAVVLAVLMWLGLRPGYLLIAALGAALMVLAVIDAGMLTIAFWVIGGIYLTLGLVAWVGARSPTS